MVQPSHNPIFTVVPVAENRTVLDDTLAAVKRFQLYVEVGSEPAGVGEWIDAADLTSPGVPRLAN